MATAPAEMASWSAVWRPPQIDALPLTIFTANIINMLKAATADEIGARNVAIAFAMNSCDD